MNLGNILQFGLGLAVGYYAVKHWHASGGRVV